MHFTARKDMVGAALVVGAGLMFQIGAVFGRDPPEGFFKANAMAGPGAVAGPPALARRPSPGVTVANFLDQPAALQDVTIDGLDGRARLDLLLGPGAINPRFSREEGGLLVILGLGGGGGATGPGQGLVSQWTVRSAAGKASATFVVKRPFVVARVLLDDTRGDGRHLLIDLVEACGPKPGPPPRAS